MYLLWWTGADVPRKHKKRWFGQKVPWHQSSYQLDYSIRVTCSNEIHWLPRAKRERRGSFSSEDGIMCVQEGEVFVSPQMVSANTHFTLCIGPMKAHSAGFSLSCCSRAQLWTDILFHTPPLELVIAAIRLFSPGNRSTNGMTMLLEDLFQKEFYRTFYS